jgi:hypothetical protein
MQRRVQCYVAQRSCERKAALSIGRECLQSETKSRGCYFVEEAVLFQKDRFAWAAKAEINRRSTFQDWIVT